jgi:large subunit ribosomal protein L4
MLRLAFSRLSLVKGNNAVSMTTRSMTAGVTIPTNLHLEDLEVVLEPEAATTPSIREEEFVFPPLKVTEALEVVKFKEPGIKTGEMVPLDPTLFGVALRKDIVHEVIRYQRAKVRQPKKTKRVGEISGSKKKPRPQKGQGLSQVGNKRNSAWRGGMKAHGPVIRDYSFSLNRKFRAMGMMICLSAKLREGNLHVFDSITADSPKTKDLLKLLEAHNLSTDKTIYIDNDFNMNFALASRNLGHVHPMQQEQANVYDLVRNEKLVISAQALQDLQERLLAQYTYNGKRRFYSFQKQLLDAATSRMGTDP